MCFPFIIESLMVFFFLFWFENDLNEIYPYHDIFMGLCFNYFFSCSLNSKMNIHCIFLALKS